MDRYWAQQIYSKLNTSDKEESDDANDENVKFKSKNHRTRDDKTNVSADHFNHSMNFLS